MPWDKGLERLVSDPDLAGFEQADKDSDYEVEVLGCGVTGRRGETKASLAEKHVQSALLLHDFRRDGPVKDRDQHAQQQSCEFHNHRLIFDFMHGRGARQSVEKPSPGLKGGDWAPFKRARIKAVLHEF